MSFADMTFLLLAFFVMLLSMSTPNKKRYEHVADTIQKELNPRTKENLQELYERVKEQVKAQKLDTKVGVIYDNNGVHVEFKDGVLFASGSANPNKAMENTIKSVLAVIADAPQKYALKIEGHTDDIPLSGSKTYASNWELSAGRGFALMRRFQDQGVAEDRMSVLALAHTKPKVATAGLTGKNLDRARAANRRVIITID